MNEEVQFFHIQEEMEVGDEVEEEGEGAKPRKSAPLVTENQADLSRKKDIFHDRRKGMRRKMKILKLEPQQQCSARVLKCSSPPLSHATPGPTSSWDRVGVCVTDWPCDYGKPWPGPRCPHLF